MEKCSCNVKYQLVSRRYCMSCSGLVLWDFTSYPGKDTCVIF